MNVQTGSWGPFQNAKECEASVPKDDLDKLDVLDEIFRYDAYSIHLARGPESLWIIHTFERTLSDERPEGIERQAYVTHHLSFSGTQEEVLATLHGEFVPTEQTYELSDAVYRSQFSFDYDAENKTSTQFAFERKKISVADAKDDDIIDEAQRPGERLVFANIPADRDGPADHRQYSYPVPQDEVLAYLDHPRNWIGRFPKNPATSHLVVCISDEKGGAYVQHRLDYETTDDELFRSTLASGAAPTMASYRLAKNVWTETQTWHDDGTWTLEIDKIDIHGDDWEKPRWQDADDYQAKLSKTIQSSSVDIT